MTSPNVAGQDRIELPGLSATNFNLAAADVVLSSSNDNEHPYLTLRTPEDFEYSYEEGMLVVHEKQDAASSTHIVDGQVKMSTTIRGNVGSVSVFDSIGSVTIDGGFLSGLGIIDKGQEPETEDGLRLAQLTIPLGYTVDMHNISTVGGSAKLEEITAQLLNVSTVAGSIILRKTQVEIGKLSSVGGSIAVSGSSSRAWDMDSVGGNIDTYDVQGHVRAFSIAGKVTRTPRIIY